MAAAAPEQKTFDVVLITPEALVLESRAVSVQFAAHDGMLGVLTHRAPLLTRLGIGPLRLETPDGMTQRFLISGGYAQMKDNVLTILTDEAIPAAQITHETLARESAALQALYREGDDHGRREKLAARVTAMRGILEGR